ncbi:MAG: BadF/BadG/BcrA/BcrD ATPase family protein [Actinomycetota bacterium]
MSRPDLVLGVDGGNTKTVALVASRDGDVRGWARSGSSDVHDAGGADAALRELNRAIAAALDAAGAQADDVGTAVLGLAGADWPEDFDLLAATAHATLPAADVLVLNDAVNAIRCGTPDGLGVVAACGTGGTAAAAGPGGVFHRGFWPEPSGAREIGRRGLAAVQRSWLGLDPPTGLTARAVARYGADDPDDLLRRLTARDRAADADPGRLAPDVLDAADGGDAAACRIVAREGRVLGEQARVAADRSGWTGEFPLVLTGGVLRHPSPLLREAIVAQLDGRAREVAVRWEPAVAALLRALDRSGGADASRVAASLPEAALFRTD